MGVPKFFRSLSERYPCLSELVKEFQIPDFDNLYLDMNGIIHVCSHPDDCDVHFSITEEKIFSSIFHYIEVLFNLIKPRKLFFLAVDGVAPRAKMNQQRARRFRTAKDLEIREKKALEENGKPLPKERFDSNCITPGTVFMDRLHHQLQYFITNKISTDPLWQECKIILSGHQTPGEGEHKIMDYIRYLKTLPDYDDNTRHCLYGLDADLIMLGMCTHEPHFCLLREKVQFSKRRSKRIMSPDETEFYLLHLSLLREYLDLEFKELETKLPFQYNLENIIDDWVLMGFLVGNDFIPNLPELHINKGAFQVLFNAYKEVLPTLDGYLNENGYLNLPRFQKYMEKMAEFDLETFEDAFVNLSLWEEVTGIDASLEKSKQNSELENLIKATQESLGLLDEESDAVLESEENDENDTLQWEFSLHKKNYYTSKLDYNNVTPEVLKSQAEGYIRAIQWNLHYYYQGCQSWSWFYPHHYAPYISDIKDFADLKLDFDMGKPFLPFEQLLAVLPSASKNLLPEPYRYLMTSPNSPIIDFYPESFETDLNGKQHDWEAVVLIPFIDEKRLLEAMKPYNDSLNPDERRRNQHGPMHLFTYTNEDLGAYKSIEYFPTIPSNHALVKDIFREEIAVDPQNLKYGLRPGVLLDVLYPGFPTLKHIPHTAALKKAKVQVFDRSSTGDNMILTLINQPTPCLEVIANNLLGKQVYVNWPHLIESRVISVSDGKIRYYLKDDTNLDREELCKESQLQYATEEELILNRYFRSLGIEIGPVNVIVHALQLDGKKYSFDTTGKTIIEKIWSTSPIPCAFQLIVLNVDVQLYRTRNYRDLREAFKVDSVVFMLGQPHFGSMGRITDSSDCYDNGRLNVELETVMDPVVNDLLLKKKPKAVYFSSRQAASKIGISPHLLSRITGSIFVSMTKVNNVEDLGSKLNIGLNMKFFKKNEEIPGYTKRENDNWLYSMDAIRVVSIYVEKFSKVMEYLNRNINVSVFFVGDIFPESEGVEEVKEMAEWIKSQEYNKIERIQCGTLTVDPELIASIEEIVERCPKEPVIRNMKVKPHLLYKHDLVSGNIPPIKSAQHFLLDRVVSIKSSYTVPTGLRGFIIAIHPAPFESDIMYDVLFDKPFLGGTNFSSASEKKFRMSRASFLNITDAYRQYHKATVPGFIPVSTYKTCYQPQLLPASTLLTMPTSGETKPSAFVQWNPQPAKQVEPVQNNDQFQQMWSNLQTVQTVKPQEDVLKKILKIEEQEQLQQKKEDIDDPVKSFFEKVSKVPLYLEKPVESAKPKNKYYLQLFSYYQRQGLGQPRFKYLYVVDKVIAQVFFRDGKVYSGLPCEDKESACESAALQALSSLGEVPLSNETNVPKEDEKKIKILENQMKLSNALLNPKASNKNKGLPPLLPNPPLQWVGLTNYSSVHQVPFPSPMDNMYLRPNINIPDKPNCSFNMRQNASSLEFVPLQAVTGKRNFKKIPTIQSPKPAAETPKATEVASTSVNNTSSSSSSKKRNRKPKIAAKLNLDPNLF